MPYSPRDYWQRLHERGDLSAVGQSSLPAPINTWLYLTLARNYGLFVDRHRLASPVPRRVYDVGAGRGFWMAWWRRRGAVVIDGCDLVPEAVARLNRMFDGVPGRVVVADIGDVGDLSEETYDLVSCQNVLLHVTDDAAFQRALANIARLVAPGGVLLMTEPILVHAAYERPYTADMSSRARPLRAYSAPLEAAGLRLERLEAATVIGNNPLEAATAATYGMLSLYWRAVAKCSRLWPGSASLVGRFIYHLDPLAMRTHAMTTAKFALFRRPTALSDPPGPPGSSGP
jgi:SAM-dependent methyltransferase